MILTKEHDEQEWQRTFRVQVATIPRSCGLVLALGSNPR